VPYWAKDIKVGFANINVKAEGIENKPASREAFQRRRCLVPVENKTTSRPEVISSLGRYPHLR
jgi:putative SOS response-associated peptidase YedK